MSVTKETRESMRQAILANPGQAKVRYATLKHLDSENAVAYCQEFCDAQAEFEFRNKKPEPMTATHYKRWWRSQ